MVRNQGYIRRIHTSQLAVVRFNDDAQMKLGGRGNETTSKRK